MPKSIACDIVARMTTRLAFDRSARSIDADGRLHVAKTHISKANICPYYGQEIPGWEELGLQADKVYRLYRDPVELERGAHTFARLPVLSEHVPVTVDSPRPDLVVGAIGSDVAFNAPYLDADISVWDSSALAGIDTGDIKELSCAYRYVPVMEPGEVDGEKYDGRMTEIRGNHLALVPVGRAGSDVVVADANPFNPEVQTMKFSKLGKALFAALSAASPVLAADSALPALVGAANRKTFKKAEVRAKLLAMDADIDEAAMDNILDGMTDVEDEPKPQETPAAAADESPEARVRALLRDKVEDSVMDEVCSIMGGAMKPAADADPDEDDKPAEDSEPEEDPKPAQDEEEKPMSKEEMKAAMDSLRADLLAAENARRDVRATVGDIQVGMDSAADVYGFALDHMKVDREGVEGVAALRALYKVAAGAAVKAAVVTPRVAQDAASVAAMNTRFPNIGRFGQA